MELKAVSITIKDPQPLKPSLPIPGERLAPASSDGAVSSIIITHGFALVPSQHHSALSRFQLSSGDVLASVMQCMEFDQLLMYATVCKGWNRAVNACSAWYGVCDVRFSDHLSYVVRDYLRRHPTEIDHLYRDDRTVHRRRLLQFLAVEHPYIPGCGPPRTPAVVRELIRRAKKAVPPRDDTKSPPFPKLPGIVRRLFAYNYYYHTIKTFWVRIAIPPSARRVRRRRRVVCVCHFVLTVCMVCTGQTEFVGGASEIEYRFTPYFGAAGTKISERDFKFHPRYADACVPGPPRRWYGLNASRDSLSEIASSFDADGLVAATRGPGRIASSDESDVACQWWRYDTVPIQHMTIDLCEPKSSLHHQPVVVGQQPANWYEPEPEPEFGPNSKAVASAAVIDPALIVPSTGGERETEYVNADEYIKLYVEGRASEYDPARFVRKTQAELYDPHPMKYAQQLRNAAARTNHQTLTAARCKSLFVSLRRQIYAGIRAGYERPAVKIAQHNLSHEQGRLHSNHLREKGAVRIKIAACFMIFSVLLPIRLQFPNALTGAFDPDSELERWRSWIVPCVFLWIAALLLLCWTVRVLIRPAETQKYLFEDFNDLSGSSEYLVRLRVVQTPPPARHEMIRQRRVVWRVFMAIACLNIAAICWALFASPFAFAGGAFGITAHAMLWPVVAAAGLDCCFSSYAFYSALQIENRVVVDHPIRVISNWFDQRKNYWEMDSWAEIQFIMTYLWLQVLMISLFATGVITPGSNAHVNWFVALIPTWIVLGSLLCIWLVDRTILFCRGRPSRFMRDQYLGLCELCMIWTVLLVVAWFLIFVTAKIDPDRFESWSASTPWLVLFIPVWIVTCGITINAQYMCE